MDKERIAKLRENLDHWGILTDEEGAEVLDALEAALARAEGAGWKLIESRPAKSDFYLLHSEGKVSVGRYQAKKDEWKLPPGWFGTYEPAHWMPLPAAPEPRP